ncbi:unnamed protein product [Ilex paraguariensis]|uniref:Uncharacterized protein n=1 Tax=Ilex paraguariensis TaxID=185542 RepID=A0ABC8S431_9AQUA
MRLKAFVRGKRFTVTLADVVEVTRLPRVAKPGYPCVPKDTPKLDAIAGANAKIVVLLHAMGNGVQKDLPNLIVKEIFDASNNEFSMVLFLWEELLLLCMRKKGVEFPIVVEYKESISAILGSTVGKNTRQATIMIDEDEGGDIGV